MDDLEKKDLQNPDAEPEKVEEIAEPVEETGDAIEEAAEPVESQPSPTQLEDDLVKELEGIRDLLQNELDTASAEQGEVGGELIQELEEFDDSLVEDEDEPAPKRICECCGERECDDSYGEDYPYCSDCRKLMTASPVHVGGIIMTIVMIIIAGASLFFCAGNASGYITLMEADVAYNENRLIDAATFYTSYIQSLSSDDVSLKAVKRLVEIFTSMGYYSDATTMINNYGDLSASIGKSEKYAAVVDTYNSFLDTSEAINNAIGDVINSSAKFDYEEKAAELDKLKESTTEDGEKYNEVFIEYYKYVLMSLANVDFEKQVEQLLKVMEIDEGKNKWIYMPNLVNVYANQGDAENAGRYFEECMDVNVQESDLYQVYANAYRFGEEVDADKILEIAARAEVSWPASYAPGYQTIYAIGYLLKGDGESAMKAIEEYVGNGNYTVSACNLYALCSLYVGDDEGYQKMVDVFESAGVEMSKDVKKYKNGKMTLEEVLTDNGGEI